MAHNGGVKGQETRWEDSPPHAHPTRPWRDHRGGSPLTEGLWPRAVAVFPTLVRSATAGRGKPRARRADVLRSRFASLRKPHAGATPRRHRRHKNGTSMTASPSPRPPLPPFDRDAAIKKVRLGEDAGNLRHPQEPRAAAPGTAWGARAGSFSPRAQGPPAVYARRAPLDAGRYGGVFQPRAGRAADAAGEGGPGRLHAPTVAASQVDASVPVDETALGETARVEVRSELERPAHLAQEELAESDEVLAGTERTLRRPAAAERACAQRGAYIGTGASTRCSPRNQTCSSLVRITSLTSRSFVPSSPSSAACRAMARASFTMISWACRSREICTGTASRPRGRRGISVISATSCAIAMLTPPSDWMRSASASTMSLCSLKCLSNRRCSWQKLGPDTCQ